MAPMPEPLADFADPAACCVASRAVIGLEAIAANGRHLAAIAGTPWMAIVKADAYGHGILPVSLACLEAGASWLGVAQLPEALALRDLLDAAGVARPDGDARPQHPRIFTWLAPVMTPEVAAIPGSPLRRAFAADLDLSVSTRQQLAALVAAVRAERGRDVEGALGDEGPRREAAPARIHLKVDTGMSRAGATLDDLPQLALAAARAQSAGEVQVVGLWSHLSRADEPESGSTEDHLARFRAGERIVREAGLAPQVRHLAATGGALWHPDSRLDLVRLGIGLYGLSPDPAVATSAELGLTPAMRLEAPLVQVKRVPDGQAVSYGGTWHAPTDRWLGLVPVGYGDGIPRAAASCGPVWVNGLRTRAVGRICMDQFVIDLGPAVDDDGHALPAPAQAGDVATLWGAPGYDGRATAASGARDADAAAVGLAAPAGVYQSGKVSDAVGLGSGTEADPAPGAIPTADEWAQACGTINYEIVTRLGPRVPRVYRGCEHE